MWKITKGGAINFNFVRRIYIQKAMWNYKGKDYNCAIVIEFSDNEKRQIEFFNDADHAQILLDNLIAELNKVKVLNYENADWRRYNFR